MVATLTPSSHEVGVPGKWLRRWCNDKVEQKELENLEKPSGFWEGSSVNGMDAFFKIRSNKKGQERLALDELPSHHQRGKRATQRSHTGEGVIIHTHIVE